MKVERKLKEKAPENLLGIYLTKKNISNIDIYAKTGIPTTDLSRLRSGQISSIPALKLYLISLVANESIDAIVKEIYPNLRLIESEKRLTSITKPSKRTTLGSILDSLLVSENTIELISKRTGIKLPRLKDLARKAETVILAHELYLIELATSQDAGALFNTLYRNNTLNSPEDQDSLKSLERSKSRK